MISNGKWASASKLRAVSSDGAPESRSEAIQSQIPAPARLLAIGRERPQGIGALPAPTATQIEEWQALVEQAAGGKTSTWARRVLLDAAKRLKA